MTSFQLLPCFSPLHSKTSLLETSFPQFLFNAQTPYILVPTMVMPQNLLVIVALTQQREPEYPACHWSILFHVFFLEILPFFDQPCSCFWFYLYSTVCPLFLANFFSCTCFQLSSLHTLSIANAKHSNGFPYLSESDSCTHIYFLLCHKPYSQLSDDTPPKCLMNT